MELKDLLVRTQYILEDLELIEELLDTNKLKEARDLSLQVNFGIEKINDDLNSLIDLHNKIDIKANDINTRFINRKGGIFRCEITENKKFKRLF